MRCSKGSTPGTYLRDWAYSGRQQTSYIGFSAGEAKIHYFGYVCANGYVLGGLVVAF